jgi:hypothetical protein
MLTIPRIVGPRLEDKGVAWLGTRLEGSAELFDLLACF